MEEKMRTINPQQGRFLSPRDVRLFTSFAQEVLGDVAQVTCFLFVRNSIETKTNIYGESSNGSNQFYAGIECSCVLKKSDLVTLVDNFGPDLSRTLDFCFLRKDLQLINIYPQIGDVIEYDGMLMEINSMQETNNLGDQPTKSWDIVCRTTYSRLSKLSLLERQI